MYVKYFITGMLPLFSSFLKLEILVNNKAVHLSEMKRAEYNNYFGSN